MTSFTPTTLNYPQLQDTPIRRVKATRNPTTSDRHNFRLGDEWLNTTAQLWWKLVAVTNIAATWVALSGSGVGVLTINNVPATMNNITLAATAPITITNNVATSTITIGSSGNVPTTFTTNSGSAAPVGNIIQILGVGGISTSGSSNIITIAASGAFPWNLISSSQTLNTNNGYFCVGGGNLSVALPTTSAVGDTLEIALNGSTSFTLTQGASQQIRVSGSVSTSGIGGSVATTGSGDSITLKCQVANEIWVALSYDGNLTVT